MTQTDPAEQTADPCDQPRVVTVLGRSFTLPRSRRLRVAIGVALCILGVFGFLPILGFWMIPLGLLILSYEFAVVRRLRRRMVVWWERRRRPDASRPTGK